MRRFERRRHAFFRKELVLSLELFMKLMATENLFHYVTKGKDSTEISVFTTLGAELYAEISTKFISFNQEIGEGP